jgi:hypothetical protein
MSRSVPQAQAPRSRTIRLVAVPSEHGGWGFLFEPAVLGLLVAPSIAGVWLALAMVAVFLLRQPLKLALVDRRNGRRYPRTIWAERVAALCALTALFTFGLALLTTTHSFWLPIALAVPFALAQAYYDHQRRSRQLAAELAGAMAIGAGVSAIALAGGWQLAPALALWAVLAVRSVASILYVRARLRLEREGVADRTASWATHGAGLVVVSVLAYLGVLPWLAMLAVAILAARALWGLSPLRRPARAQVIGLQEIMYGLLTVLLVALGHAAGI